MSRSPLPPVPGETPVKVIFETSDPGANAQQLLMDNQGAIGHFQQKARQSRELSGQPQAAMQGSLPGGGRIRSVYNNGQESLYVRLNPVGGEEPIPIDEPKYLPPPVPHLAIDVLFNSDRYLVADVYAHSDTDPGEPTVEVDVFSGTRDPSMVPGDPPFSEGATRTETYGAGDNGEYWALAKFTEQLALPNPYTFEDPPGTHWSVVTTASWVQLTRTDGGHWGPLDTRYDPDTGGSSIWAMTEFTTTSTITTPGVSVRVITHDTMESFDVVNIAGLVGDPENKPYEAHSAARSTDDRILRAVDLSAIQTIQRMVDAHDTEALDGITGIGFLAKPFQDVIPGEQSPDPTIIDVYLATDNNSKANENPGLEGSTVDGDDASFTYGTGAGLEFRIRAREYTYEAVGAVMVDTEIGQKKQHDQIAPTAVIGAPTYTPRVERERDWAFAAVKGWVDLGGEPADPTADGMGKKLDDTVATNHDAGAAPEDRKIFDQPEWAKKVTEMVKVARITWHPSTTPGINGTAEIELV